MAPATTAGKTVTGSSHPNARHWPPTGPPSARGAGLPRRGRLRQKQKQRSVTIGCGSINIAARYPLLGGRRRFADGPVLFAPFTFQPGVSSGLILATECAPDGEAVLFRGRPRVRGLWIGPGLEAQDEWSTVGELAQAVNAGDCIQLAWDGEGLRQSRAFDPSTGGIIWVSPCNRSDRDWWDDGIRVDDIPADAPRDPVQPVSRQTDATGDAGRRGRPISDRAYKTSIDATGPGIAAAALVAAAAELGASATGPFRPLEHSIGKS